MEVIREETTPSGGLGRDTVREENRQEQGDPVSRGDLNHLRTQYESSPPSSKVDHREIAPVHLKKKVTTVQLHPLVL